MRNRHQLALFDLQDCTPAATPMEVKQKLAVDMHAPAVDATHYKSLVGKLIQLCHTRFDSQYGTGKVSQFMARSQVPHLKAARRILRYIKGTWNYGILYRPLIRVFRLVDSD